MVWGRGPGCCAASESEYRSHPASALKFVPGDSLREVPTRHAPTKPLLDDLREGLPGALVAREDLVGLEVDRDGLHGHALTMHLWNDHCQPKPVSAADSLAYDPMEAR